MDRLEVHATTKDTSGVLIAAADRRLELEYSDKAGREKLCPVELLCMALAGCISLTIRSVAEVRGYPLEDVEVRVITSPDYGRPPKAEHVINIALHGELTQKARTILARSAKTCHVHKLLSGDNTFHFNLDGESV
jgi:uncharacterized OsmC-like protein